MSGDMLELLQGLLSRAKKAGADAGDAVHVESRSLSVAQRLGAPEKLERSESADVGLRVFVGKSQAIVSSSDISEGTLDELAERAVAMAGAVPEDHRIQQGVGSQPVPAVDANAGTFTSGVDTRQVGLSVHVGLYPTHYVMHARADGHRVLNHVYANQVDADLPNLAQLFHN